MTIDQLELRSDNDNSLFAWEVEGWIGKDLNKLWIKTDGEDTDDFQFVFGIRAWF